MPINERETNIQNWTVPRILAAVAAIILTAFPLLTLRTNGVNFLASWFGAGFVLAPATIAALCWWFATRGNCAASRARMMYALIGAMGLGGIAFFGGFIGPIILTPDANCWDTRSRIWRFCKFCPHQSNVFWFDSMLFCVGREYRGTITISG